MELPLLRKKTTISLEMIDFQDDNFGSDLEVIITNIQRKVLEKIYKDSKEIADSKEVKDLISVIFKRTGLNFKVICHSALAAVLSFYSNKNHIFINEMFRGGFDITGQEKILRTAHNKKGTVSTKNATVDGIFSEYANLLYLNFYGLFGDLKLSVPEVVAVMLHEIGHAFYACEYSDRLETTNQTLQSVAEELNRKKDKADAVYIFRELKTVNPKTTEEEVDKLISGDKIIAGYTWFRVVVGSVEEQLQNKKYAETSFEQMADNFAARFKYGRQLITAVDKLHGHLGSIEKSPMWQSVNELMSLLTLIVPTVACVYFFPISMPLSLLYGLVSFLVLRINGEDCKDYTYDELKIRYKRVRNQYVEFLKNLDIPNEYIKNTLNDIYIVDRTIDETRKYSTLLNSIANFIFSNARAANASIVEQQMLEELTFSDLFVKSAELKVLNK